ncbi:universal stress protein [Halobacillus fulvus]|nr:universal stress protein [Halobacillus fulvus]
MYKRILLASDGSDHAVRAAKHAAGLSDLDEQSNITVLYSIEGTQSKYDALHENSRDLSDVRKGRLFSTEKVLKDHGADYKVEVVKGEPGPSIVKVANEGSYDVVVIGSRGLNTLQEMVLGSVSHKVAKRADCPVLIIK